MYALEITCLNCKEKLIFERAELWRIAMLSNELETRIREEKLSCKPCQQIGPMHIVVKNLAMYSLVIFEKNISSIHNGNHNSKLGFPQTCIACTAKGYIEVKYKAHKKMGSFKGILNETCPMCNGKGYFK